MPCGWEYAREFLCFQVFPDLVLRSVQVFFAASAGEFTAVSMTVGKGFTYILGMIVAGVTGYLVIRFMLKLSNQVRLRYFAFYSFAAGILILAANYI